MSGFHYFPNDSTDPTYNLALEEYLLLERRDSEFFLLWRNEPTVVLGRNQNTLEEINPVYIEEHAIHVVRRISGGGAVYHDWGNLNFSFLIDDSKVGFDFARFTEPLIRTLRNLGIDAENTGRNDVAIQGRKISGNAQYKHRGRMLHHGTVLFDSDLERLANTLKPTPEKYRSKAIASVRSRVGNVREFLQTPIGIEEFREELRRNIQGDVPERNAVWTESDQRAVEKLQREKYRTWEWNYGFSPPFENRGEGGTSRKFPWGTLDLRLEIKDGLVRSCVFYGDFFQAQPTDFLRDRLIGLRFDRSVWENDLNEADIRSVFPELSRKELLELVFG